jgi:hypothetical protein
LFRNSAKNERPIKTRPDTVNKIVPCLYREQMSAMSSAALSRSDLSERVRERVVRQQQMPLF